MGKQCTFATEEHQGPASSPDTTPAACSGSEGEGGQVVGPFFSSSLCGQVSAMGYAVPDVRKDEDDDGFFDSLVMNMLEGDVIEQGGGRQGLVGHPWSNGMKHAGGWVGDLPNDSKPQPLASPPMVFSRRPRELYNEDKGPAIQLPQTFLPSLVIREPVDGPGGWMVPTAMTDSDRLIQAFCSLFRTQGVYRQRSHAIV